MTDKDIELELRKDYDNFQNKVYDGKVKVPENIKELFERSILSLPAYSHKLSFRKVQSIMEIPVEKLPNNLISDMIKTILNTRLEELYKKTSFQTIVKESIKFEDFVRSFNQQVDDFQKHLENRRSLLKAITKQGNVNGSPLKLAN